MGSTELNAERLGWRLIMHEGISYQKAKRPEASASTASGSTERFKFLF